MRYVIRGGKATSRGRRGLTRAPSTPPRTLGAQGGLSGPGGRAGSPGDRRARRLSTGPGPNTCLQSETVSAFFCFSAWVGLG